MDVRPVLPAVQAPTLVIHRVGDHSSTSPTAASSPTKSPAPATSNSTAPTTTPGSATPTLLDETERFLDGSAPGATIDCVLTTIMATELPPRPPRTTSNCANSSPTASPTTADA